MTTLHRPARPLRAETSPLPSGGTPDRPAVVWAIATAIVFVGLLAYANSLTGVLVLDDVRAIARNPTIRMWTSALEPPSASTVAGRPIANLSFAVNYALAPPAARDVFEPPPGGGDSERARLFLTNVRGYRLGNLAIHLTAALLVFGVVRRTLRAPRLRATYGPAATAIAGAAAAVWVVHPMTTAAVTYVVQRVEALMALWYLLTLYASIRASDSRRRRVWAAMAVASCAAGMATKEVMVTAPLVVWAWFAVCGEPTSDRFRAKLVAALGLTWLVLGFLVWGERRLPSTDLALETSWRYLVTQGAVILHYLRLAIVPVPLAFLYDWPIVTRLTDGLLEALVVAALAGTALWACWRRQVLGFAGLAFFLILAPSSSVLPIVTEVAAEHRMYLPLAVLVSAVCTAVWTALRRLTGPRTQRVVGLGLVSVAVAGYGATTMARNVDYHDAVALWTTAVDARPDDARARVALGSALAARGNVAEAEDHLRRAVERAPGDATARVRLGSVFAQQQKLGAAAGEFQAALALRPDDIDAHRFLADVHAMRREDAQAVRHYAEALRLLPGDVELQVRLAAVLADSRDLRVRDATRALALAEPAVRLTHRRDLRALEVLSVAYAGLFRWVEAAAASRDAAALARQRNDHRRASALEYRASAYDEAARQGLRR